jgi:DNA polymerase-3 subunit epsilon
VVRAVGDDAGRGAAYLGPFGSVKAAEQAVAALHEAFPLRQCTKRLPARPAAGASACALAEMGRCGAPCTGDQTREDYAGVVSDVRTAMTSDARRVLDAVLARIGALSASQRYEDAAAQRDRLVAFVRAASRVQRISPLASIAELVAARRADAGGWEVVVVRHGRLAATTTTPRGADPTPFIDAVRATAEQVAPAPAPAPAAHPEETEKVLRWLEADGVRLVHVEGAWSCPVNGAGAHRSTLDPLETARSAATPFPETPTWRSPSRRAG